MNPAPAPAHPVGLRCAGVATSAGLEPATTLAMPAALPTELRRPRTATDGYEQPGDDANVSAKFGRLTWAIERRREDIT